MKTYIPRLMYLLNIFCRYANKWHDKFRPHLTEPQRVAYDALMVACDAFRLLYNPPDPE